VSLHPKLVDWQSHYSLGTIVREIYNEFTRSPPTPGQSQPAAAQQQPLVSSSLPPKFDNRSQPQAQPPKPKNKKNTIPQPELPKSFPLLNNKTNEELLALLGGGFEAQVAKMALVQDMATSKSMQTLRNDLYKGIDSLSSKYELFYWPTLHVDMGRCGSMIVCVDFQNFRKKHDETARNLRSN